VRHAIWFKLRSLRSALSEYAVTAAVHWFSGAFRGLDFVAPPTTTPDYRAPLRCSAVILWLSNGPLIFQRCSPVCRPRRCLSSQRSVPSHPQLPESRRVRPNKMQLGCGVVEIKIRLVASELSRCLPGPRLNPHQGRGRPRSSCVAAAAFFWGRGLRYWPGPRAFAIGQDGGHNFAALVLYTVLYTSCCAH
jgi:hypothetical protein